MDLTTIIGIAAGIGIFYWGMSSGDLLAVFINLHGIVIVLGGVLAATLLNTPSAIFVGAVKAAAAVFFLPRTRLSDLAAVIVRLSEEAKTRGVFSLQLEEEEKKLAGGFLERAVRLTKENNDPEFIRDVLEQEIAQKTEYNQETVNVYRTMGMLAPMFGLLGTLIGIIEVLKKLANPEEVGAAMAVAITSAFYGIGLANMMMIPMAGKIRVRQARQIREMDMVLEGVMEILKGSIPMHVRRKLTAFMTDEKPAKERKQAAASPAAALAGGAAGDQMEGR